MMRLRGWRRGTHGRRPPDYMLHSERSRPRAMKPRHVSSSIDELVDRAIANADEHAIKFTEACIHEYALNPKPVYLAAAAHAIERLPPLK